MSSSRAERAFKEVIERVALSCERQTKSVCLQVGDKCYNAIMGSLTCHYISEDKEKRMPGFAKNSNGRWQFDTMSKTQLDGQPFLPSTTAKRCRRMVTTLPFYFEQYVNESGDTMDSADVTSSHLCHHDACVNFDHISYEGLDYNKSRNWCFGGRYCALKPKCLRAGRGVQNIVRDPGGVLAKECAKRAFSSHTGSEGAGESEQYVPFEYLSSQSKNSQSTGSQSTSPSPAKKPKT